MKNKNKVIILTSIIVGVLVVTLGLTYAAITFNETKGNSKLVLGDIWMHYGESNQLVLNDAMPKDINTYIVNPVMASQEVNELTRCVNYFTEFGISNEVLDDGSTLITYCQGSGTTQGFTFADTIEYAPETEITKMLDLNIIVQSGDVYIPNPIMTSQEIGDNELGRCINFYTNGGFEFDEGSGAESFCKGTGTIEGRTLEEGLALGFDEAVAQKFLDSNIIIPQIENLPYFEFTVDGKNTYTKKDIWYEIVLNHGDEHATRKTRIKDNLLKFALVEVVDGNEIVLFNNKNYSNIINKRIYVDTIPANTNEEVNRTYRLYMWISEDTVIGNVNQDYTIDEWNDVYASIKVNVTGDFNEKELDYDVKYNVTNESCFETEVVTTYKVNPIMTTQEAVDNELTRCISYYNGTQFDEGSDAESYCRGIGTIEGLTIQENLDDWVGWAETVGGGIETFLEEGGQELIDADVILQITDIVITNYYKYNLNFQNSLYHNKSCGSDVVIPQTINGYSVTTIGESAFANNQLTSVVIPNCVVEIDSHAFFSSQLASVIFEKNSNLTLIGGYAFYSNELTSVEIPNSVTIIDENAFKYNQLVNINIPNNVITIGEGSFEGNHLTSVTFEKNSKLDRIDDFAFNTNSITSVTIPNSVSYLSCSAFDDDVAITKNNNLVCTPGGPR